jgi:glyoxylase-like metal-dependent hydrolase (beta-lactamase superfamily II)
MLQWQVGDVTITRIVELELPVPYNPKRPLIAEALPDALQSMPWLYPHFVTADGHLMTAVHALLVQTPSRRVVVDTCIGNDKPRRMTLGHGLDTPFLQHMQELGWTRESVDTVICTHLHVDHVGWNTLLDNGRWTPTFPRARYLVGRTEYAYWSEAQHAERHAEHRAIMNDSVQPLFDAGLVDLVDVDHQLCPELRLIPTPGHTPGHVSVLIESQGASALITGDVLHHPCQIGRPDWTTTFDEDKQAASAQRKQVLERFADKTTLVIGTHFSAPTAGRIKRDGDSFRFEVS